MRSFAFFFVFLVKPSKSGLYFSYSFKHISVWTGCISKIQQLVASGYGTDSSCLCLYQGRSANLTLKAGLALLLKSSTFTIFSRGSLHSGWLECHLPPSCHHWELFCLQHPQLFFAGSQSLISAHAHSNSPKISKNLCIDLWNFFSV